MGLLRGALRRVGALARRRRLEQEMDEEIRLHLHYETEKNLRAGMSPGEARRRAVLAFGGVEKFREEVREARGLPSLEQTLQDLSYAARTLRRSPGFTLAAVLTLALGIGANTAIFSVVNALLLRPIPGVERPGELVRLGRTDAGQGFDTFSHPDYADYREATGTLSGVAAHSRWPVHLSTGAGSERLRAELVSGSYFGVLGVRAARGRVLLPSDDALPGEGAVAVLTHRLWRTRFGGDPGAVGSTVRLNGEPFTVVGVAPAGFEGTEVGGSADLFVPLSMHAAVLPGGPTLLGERAAVWLHLFARLRPGVAAEAAQAELSAVARRIESAHPDTHRGRGIAVSPGIGHSPEGRRDARALAGILLGVVALVLLIACANVANLLLARSLSRGREIAVRAAVGASRRRLVRQLLTESLLLAGLGAGLGSLLALLGGRALLRLPIFADGVGSLEPGLDARVLAFTASVALLSGLGFGLAPAARAARPDLAETLRAGPQSGGAARSRLRRALLTAQVALSLVLLVGAGLLVRTLQNLYRIPPGFDAARVTLAAVDVELQGYDEARGRRFYDELLRGVSALPGVEAASAAYMVPLSGGGWDTRVLPDGVPSAPEEAGVKTDRNSVTPDYFRATGMRVVRGRGFTPADREGAPPVVVVNRALAAALWPGEDPLGRRLRMLAGGEALEVVGVVEDAKYRSLVEAPRPFLYHPFAQQYQGAMTLHVRATGDPRAVLARVEREVARLDPHLPLYRTGTLAEWLDRSLAAERTVASLVSAFGLLALLLASVGLYGSVAYVVAQRTREIGIRMALGARERQVAGMVLTETLLVVAAGIALGVAAALPAARVLEGRLYAVSPADPLTFAGVAALLVCVALLAGHLPARRASRVDPTLALRSDG